MATRYEKELFKLERGLDAIRFDSSPLADLLAPKPLATSVKDALKISTASSIGAEIQAASNFTATVAEQIASFGLAKQSQSDAFAQAIGGLVPDYRGLLVSYNPLGQYMTTLGLTNKLSYADSWKPALVRQSWLPETTFVSRLPDIDRSLYSAIRPELWTVAQGLLAQSEGVMQSMVVQWRGCTEMDFEFDLGEEDPPIEGSAVVTPSGKRQLLTPDVPMETIDTTPPVNHNRRSKEI